MLALSITCRPHWRDFLLHQLAKQETLLHLVVFDDSKDGISWPKVRGISLQVIRPERRLQLSLGEKRELVLEQARRLGEPFAWFDDDDWHPQERLYVGGELVTKDRLDAVGYEWGTFCDVTTLQTRRINAGSRLCFNSAIFSPQCARAKFQPLHRGEDTAWLGACLKDATVVSSPMFEHAWMSHNGNVTGKRGSMSFESPRFTRFDSWEREFLKHAPSL